MANKTVKIPYKPRPEQKLWHGTDKRWAIIVAHRRFGKTTMALNGLIKGALTSKTQAPRFAYLTPLLKQAKAVAWDMLKHFSRPIPGIKINEAELRVDYPGDGRVQLFGCDNPDALRGQGFDGVVLDEYAQMPPSLFDEVIRPALSDRRGWCLWIGTPKGVDAFYRLYYEHRDDADWYVAMHRASETGALPESELDQARAQMTGPEYAAEYECSFIADSDQQLISTQDVTDAMEREPDTPDLNAPLILGVDVARFGDDSSALIYRRAQDATSVPLARYRDTSITDMAGLVADSIAEHQPDAVFVDETGLGAGLVDNLKALGYRVQGVNFASKSSDRRYANARAEMWGRMAEWVETASLPQDEILAQELCTPRKEYDASGRLRLEPKDKIKQRLGFSNDLGDALALTFAKSVPRKDLNLNKRTANRTLRPTTSSYL